MGISARFIFHLANTEGNIDVGVFSYSIYAELSDPSNSIDMGREREVFSPLHVSIAMGMNRWGKREEGKMRVL